ncbi:MAG: multicopper oxidase family protein [Thermodesulfobacteriota bacterium]
MTSKLNRRDFLRIMGMSGAVLGAGGGGLVLNSCDSSGGGGGGGGGGGTTNFDPRSAEGFVQPLNVPGEEGLMGIFNPEAPFLISPKNVEMEFLPGKPAAGFQYETIAGDRTYYNPVFRLIKGQQMEATMANELDEETIIHWHGLEIDSVNDGHPNNAVPGGESYNYNFPILNRGATYWYHPHPDKLVGKQAYFGLGGFYIVEDENDTALRNALDLSLGSTEIPLLIQDKNVDESGQLIFEMNPMIQTIGVLGDKIFVNQTIKPFLDVDTRIYRLRFLNSSNSRTYKLAFLKGSEKMTFNIIGNDGGLLDVPYQATEVFIGLAERVDILIDFRGSQVGDEVFLKSMAFDPMDPLTVDMDFNQPSTLMNGEEFYIMKFNVAASTSYDRQIPPTLSTIEPIDTTGAGERLITLANPIEGVWFINNFRFNPEEVPITVNRDSTEIWSIFNGPAAMPHPIHIHAVQFQILERTNSPQQVKDLAIDSAGRMPTDMGWKDVVLVWPGETVRYAVKFSIPFEGEQLYLFHCHNLEHEDQGMMINYSIL